MAHLSNIVINSVTPLRLAQWWAPLLGGTVVGESDSFVFVNTKGLNFLFQRVSDPTPGQRRIHFDFAADTGRTRAEEVAAFVKVGAQEIETHFSDGFSWTILEDPEGNQFCISDAH